MRRLILGTAGHIDHGKTALVKALTGVDTDRLKEEKERGITVDLGFAEFLPRAGVRFGVVDVPGHEGFIRNMLAGATGIDVALLVVAADEGVMPQTREHLSILRLLAVPRLVVAVSKADLVEGEWLDLVMEEIRDLLDGTPYAGTSAGTGVRGDRPGTGGAFRRSWGPWVSRVETGAPGTWPAFPIDRVFTVRGAGTVVTGTLVDRSAQGGGQGRLFCQETGRPGSALSRCMARTSNEARAGERVAVGLTGSRISHLDLSRGQTLVEEEGLDHLSNAHLPPIRSSLEPDGRSSRDRGSASTSAPPRSWPGWRFWRQIVWTGEKRAGPSFVLNNPSWPGSETVSCSVPTLPSPR
jgi:selenocysteine-specific elongation factor